MSRMTIDFGIDLGTTNSAVAVLKGMSTNVMKNNDEHDITASAVHIDKRGQIHTGLRAKNRLEDERSADDIHIEFKRHMGTDHRHEFKTSGQAMSPEQLSAEILKSLRGDVQQRTGEDIQSAVITVPAAFEQKQCAATKAAGELAGLYQCPLVMEPTAAALAYGYQSDVTKEYWLVFDFGGGTFDAALMKAEDGTIRVVNSGGDNYLGGADIDWAVIEQLVIPEIRGQFDLPDFKHGNAEWRIATAILKRAVEVAKVQLSRSDTAYIEDCRFRDASGDEIEIEYKLTRDALVSVAEPIIMRSVDICKRVLQEKDLAESAIEKIVLVGGPTLAPYFREILGNTLRIPLDFSVDPLTVVARGAAVFAGTQRIEGKAAPKAAAGEYELALKYNPVGADEDPTVRGAVKAPEGQIMEGFTIEFSNQQTHWRSGKVPVKGTGRFRVDLLAEKGEKNDFTIDLLDATGTRQKCVPDSMSYIVGLAFSEQPIIHNISVALANNEVGVFFKKGDPLPAKATRIYRSSKAVEKGSQGHVLNIPVVEGEADLADRNPLLGTLSISGADIRRSVPAGQEIEVTIDMDASRIIRTKAYIPVLDEEFEHIIAEDNSSADPKLLQADFGVELTRLEALQDKAAESGDVGIEERLEAIENGEDIEAIRRLVDAAAADPVAANNGERRLLEMKVALDKVENALEWPALVSEAKTVLSEAEGLVSEHGEEHKERLDQLRGEISELIEQERAEALRKKIEQAIGLQHDILFSKDGFWFGFFNQLVDEQDRMGDQAAAERLIRQGQLCIEKGNVQGLRNVVSQLLGLLPQEEAEAIERGHKSGLIK